MRLIPLLPALLCVFAGCAGWTNWAGNVSCRPRKIIRPTNEAELRDAVRGADRVRVAGAGHSFNGLACTDAVMIDIRSLARVLAVDTTLRRIKVEAGITLRALDEAAARHGLALATEPSIAEITAAGAIATASHGTGLGHGAFSEEVVALEVIDAEGRKIGIEDPDRLRAARVGLGALGVIYSITFRLVPAFNLAIEERVVGEEEAFAHFGELLRHNQHVDMFWFITEHKVFLRTYNQTSAPRKVYPVRDGFAEWVVKTWLAHLGLAIASKSEGIAKYLNRIEPSLFHARSEVDRSDRIFHRFPGHQRIYSMEYALPIENTRAALRAITASLRATGFSPNTPPYLRFVGGMGDGDLSPLRGRASCAIEVLSYVGFKGWERFFRDLEPRFLALGGRPHWGKLFYANPHGLYDPATWAHIEQVRAQLDPHHKFANRFTEELLAPAGAER